ncbi:MAG: hypothetical protein ACLQU3_15975 [Limisphaerales bacterium]
MCCCVKQFVNRPDVIGKASGHCGGLVVCAVNAAEVEMGDEQGNGVLEVGEFL